MRLTTKGRYAVKAMLDIAIRAYEYERWQAGKTKDVKASTNAVSLADIAERQDISVTYLEQLFRKLRHSGLVNSVRGPGGGYVLAHDASQISIADIMTAVGEGIDVVNSNTTNNPNKLAENLWLDLTNQIQTFLSSISLSDLITHHENKQFSAQQNQLFNFTAESVAMSSQKIKHTPQKESNLQDKQIRRNLIIVSQ